jgi:hypothetical protein
MTDRIDHLRDIYSRLGGAPSFTEAQQTPRGTVRADADVDRDVLAVIDELRERSGFRTTLSDADLVSVVRGFYAGRSDTALAAVLGVSTATVFRARMNLHLFAPTDAPPELDPLVRRLRGGAAVDAVAADADVPRAVVERLARLLTAREAARRVNYRYTTEFADLLDAGAADHELDQQVWGDRRALVDAHD